MNTPLPRHERVRRVLHLLALLERRHGGYFLRGVHGWARTADVDAHLGVRVPELLPALAGAGLADREDVRVPGRPHALWVYRINDHGLRRLATLDGWEPEDLDNVEPLRPHRPPRPVYLPRACRVVLHELRRAAHDPDTPTPFPGEPGWLTARQMDESFPLRYDAVDLAWLLRRGLIERRHHRASPSARQPTVYYHVTDTGRVLRPLVWYDRPGIPGHAQVG